MNTPEIYLVEPYNAYAVKGKKKHLHQILEEEALMARIVAEQQALHEAAVKQAHPTLPPQAPPTSKPVLRVTPVVKVRLVDQIRLVAAAGCHSLRFSILT